MFKKDKDEKHLVNTATTHFKTFQKVAKVAVQNMDNDQKAINSPEATPSSPDTFNDLMKDLDDLLKEEEEEDQNGYNYTNNAN